MCCLIFQGRNELGDHASGPSEKDHEQHTDNESPDAASSWHRCPGVTECDELPWDRMKSKTELIWSSAWDVTGDNHRRKRTSVVSDYPGCVWSEIIPFFLREGLWTASSNGTEKRKMAKKNSTNKKLPG